MEIEPTQKEIEKYRECVLIVSNFLERLTNHIWVIRERPPPMEGSFILKVVVGSNERSAGQMSVWEKEDLLDLFNSKHMKQFLVEFGL